MAKKIGTINIPNITGNIQITATAQKKTMDEEGHYINPTITFDSTTYKIKLTQDGYTEYIDASYAENPGREDYVSSISVSDGTQNYYLSLINPNSEYAISRFRINGLAPDIGGWFDRVSDDNEVYDLLFDSSRYYSSTFKSTIYTENVPFEYIDKVLDIFNNTFADLEVTFISSSKNKIKMIENYWDEEHFGMMWYYATYFYIELYTDVLERYAGTFAENPMYWIRTGVHELGHTLGLDDNAAHLPTQYSTRKDYNKCYYLQPNDVMALKILLKEEYDRDITTMLERCCGKSYPMNNIMRSRALHEEPAEVDSNGLLGVRPLFVFYENPEEVADIIVDCKLHFEEEICYRPSEKSPAVMYYDIYSIEPVCITKGQSILSNNNKVKIPKYCGINIDTENNYRLYLKEKENNPHSILNSSQGIKKND